MDIGASHETEEIINCIYGLKKSQSNEIESDKGSIVAEKSSNVRNDSDPNELEPDKVYKLNAVFVMLKQIEDCF